MTERDMSTMSTFLHYSPNPNFVPLSMKKLRSPLYDLHGHA